MINKNELIFAVDENNRPIAPVERHKAHADGTWHRGSDVIVINSQHQILCNRRSMLKDHDPGKWDFSFGGHIPAGVEPIQTAVNELKEESGLEADPGQLDFFSISKNSSRNNKDNQFLYAYIFKWDGNINELKLEKEEIDEAKWVNIKDLQKLLASKDPGWVLTPYIEELLGSID